MADDFAFKSPPEPATRKVKLPMTRIGQGKNSTVDDPRQHVLGAYFGEHSTFNHQDAKEVDVPVSKLRATQSEVIKSAVDKYVHDPKRKSHFNKITGSLPLGVRDTNSGKVHIVDGHHRAEAAKLRGDVSLKMKIVDKPGIEKE